MKLFQLIFMMLLPVFAVCQGKKSDITITGKITGKIPETIEYTLPVSGIDYFGFKNSVQPDSSGNFQIKLDIDKTCFVELFTNYSSYGTIIAEPGMSYDIFINTEIKENNFRVASKNEKGQALYNQIPNRGVFVEDGHFELESRKYSKDSVVTDIKQKVEQRRESEIAGFKKLLKDKIISKDFYKLVETDRNYFHKGILGSVTFINYLNTPRKQNSLTPAQYKELWNEVFQSNPVTNPELLTSPWFYYYVENYLRYKEFIVEATDIATITEFRKQEIIHTHNISNAKKYLSGRQLEYYFAAYIYYEAINKNYEKELITLFEQFKTEYPNSAYTHFLEPAIIPVIAFHKKQSELLSEKIKFIDNSAAVNSVKDVIKELKGKSYYIDIWATWCGPCKSEFKDNAKLYQLLKSKNITMVYISIDEENRENQWQDMIHFYNLEGYHIRSNEKLDADLQSLHGSPYGIPWHFLTDENGNIVNKSLSGPSEIENLEKQLNGYQ